jgi:hypothetical protein
MVGFDQGGCGVQVKARFKATTEAREALKAQLIALQKGAPN